MDDVNNVSVSGLDSEWNLLLNDLETLVGKRPADLNAVLFLIGLQELGRGPKRFTKEQKQDLLHIAVCRVMNEAGHYSLDGYDADGWPIWTLQIPLPSGSLEEQEAYLKRNVLQYFSKVLTY
ncbi:MAG: hypothetical protein EAZ91_20550 [Cytophagales bacterium]|nr:MAG: hypothetical protein EAZ91_20550 [Cytophagales bacterium]